MSSPFDDFRDICTASVGVSRLLGRDKYGTPSYGPVSNFAAHVSNKSTMIRGANGELIATKGAVWMDPASGITAVDKMILPDGSVPVILAVNSAQDEAPDDVYTRVDFG